MNIYLTKLENQSIHIIREAVATSSYRVMPSFPLVHVDTLWKFKEMIFSFRDENHIIQTNTNTN